MIVSIDADMLFKSGELQKFINGDKEILGVCDIHTKEPVYVKTELRNGIEIATSLSREKGNYEWACILKLYSDNIYQGQDHIYKMIQPNLPLNVMKLHAKEIDNMEEYKKAVIWHKSGCR